MKWRSTFMCVCKDSFFLSVYISLIEEGDCLDEDSEDWVETWSRWDKATILGPLIVVLGSFLFSFACLFSVHGRRLSLLLFEKLRPHVERKSRPEPFSLLHRCVQGFVVTLGPDILTVIAASIKTSKTYGATRIQPLELIISFT